ncbi:MAG: cupin domain-containing protein [Bryobacteraceae bacterium]|jgi:anti-sigma factor ChrR (cupin superfamily)
MTAHRAANDEIRKRASLFAVGALTPAEEAGFREHLKICGVCAQEARTLQTTASWLPFAEAGVAPPSGLRDEILARIHARALPPGIQVVRAAEGDWKTLLPGVTAKPLYQDSHTGHVTLLVRMDPGATYPPHSHADIEHCYVLEGDLHFGDLVLHPGDYQCALAGTNHRDSHTVRGCMVLIVASQERKGAVPRFARPPE